MRAQSLGLLCILLVLCLVVPTATATPGNGSLAFGVIPVLDGELNGRGAGEIHVAGNDATLSGEGMRVDVLRVWYETEVIKQPVGPVRTETGPVQMAWRNFTDATFTLDRVEDGFESLVYTTEGEVSFQATVKDHDLTAYRTPWLVTDDSGVAERQRAGESRVFTYVADGDRFLAPPATLRGTGDMAVYIGAAQFSVQPARADPVSFRSGDTRTDTTPASYRESHSYHILFLRDGAAAVTGDQATGWLSVPTFVFDGTLRAAEASGTVVVGEEEYTLDEVPLTLGGAIVLRPLPSGDVETTQENALHVGTTTRTDGRYTAASSDLDGDVTVLAIGSEIPYTEEEGLAVAATVGVLTLVGAVLLVTPKGKWLVLGLLAPLYAKTERDRLLDNESRDRIFQAIRNNPGINLSQIHRIADLGWGVTVYHLKMMEKSGLVVAQTSARDKCFFENDPRFRKLRSAIAALANREPAQKVAQAITACPGATQREVVQASGLTQRAVSYYVAKLGKEGLVESTRDGNFVHYHPAGALVEALRLVAHDPDSIQVGAVGTQDAGVVQA